MVSPVIFISGFKVGVVEHGRLHVANLKAALQLRYANTLVAKCEQILWVTSCEFDEQAESQNFLVTVDLVSTICNNNLINTGWKTWKHKPSFVSNTSSLPWKLWYTIQGFFSILFCRLLNTAQHGHGLFVFKEIWRCIFSKELSK